MPLACASGPRVIGNSSPIGLIGAGKSEAYDRMLASEDAREGPRAFAEKRTPVWRGH